MKTRHVAHLGLKTLHVVNDVRRQRGRADLLRRTASRVVVNLLPRTAGDGVVRHPSGLRDDPLWIAHQLHVVDDLRPGLVVEKLQVQKRGNQTNAPKAAGDLGVSDNLDRKNPNGDLILLVDVLVAHHDGVLPITPVNLKDLNTVQRRARRVRVVERTVVVLIYNAGLLDDLLLVRISLLKRVSRMESPNGNPLTIIGAVNAPLKKDVVSPKRISLYRLVIWVIVRVKSARSSSGQPADGLAKNTLHSV